MAGYSLSSKATDDLDGIYEYSILNFGVEKAQSYLMGLQGAFQNLANNPMIGRSAASLEPGLRRFEIQSHIVFYMPTDTGVLIVRLLHDSMDAERHLH